MPRGQVVAFANGCVHAPAALTMNDGEAPLEMSPIEPMLGTKILEIRHQVGFGAHRDAPHVASASVMISRSQHAPSNGVVDMSADFLVPEVIQIGESSCSRLRNVAIPRGEPASRLSPDEGCVDDGASRWPRALKTMCVVSTAKT